MLQLIKCVFLYPQSLTIPVRNSRIVCYSQGFQSFSRFLIIPVQVIEKSCAILLSSAFFFPKSLNPPYYWLIILLDFYVTLFLFFSYVTLFVYHRVYENYNSANLRFALLTSVRVRVLLITAATSCLAPPVLQKLLWLWILDTLIYGACRKFNLVFNTAESLLKLRLL